MDTLPGTVLPMQNGNIRYGFANFSPLFLATRGLTLSQVCEITGTELTTVQNWIKRGWVGHPEGKRYGEPHFARILLINMLRSSMQLEKIAFLLQYVNGSANDRSDDSIPDSALYSHLCLVIADVTDRKLRETDEIRNAVLGGLEDYSEPFPGAKEKLVDVLVIMTLTCIAGEYIERAEKLLQTIM